MKNNERANQEVYLDNLIDYEQIDKDKYVDLIKKYVDRLQKDPDDEETADELLYAGMKRAGTWLVSGTLKKSSDPKLPKLKSKWFEKLLDKAEELLDTTRSDPTLENRKPAFNLIEPLGFWGNASIASRLLSLLLNESDTETRTSLFTALGAIGGPDAVTGLVISIMTEDKPLALSAENLLKILGSEDLPEDLATAPALVSPDYTRDVFKQVKWKKCFSRVEKLIPDDACRARRFGFLLKLLRERTKLSDREWEAQLGALLREEEVWPAWVQSAIPSISPGFQPDTGPSNQDKLRVLVPTITLKELLILLGVDIFRGIYWQPHEREELVPIARYRSTDSQLPLELIEAELDINTSATLLLVLIYDAVKVAQPQFNLLAKRHAVKETYCQVASQWEKFGDSPSQTIELLKSSLSDRAVSYPLEQMLGRSLAEFHPVFPATPAETSFSQYCYKMVNAW